MPYRRFRCRDCGKQFNERSDGVLNRASLPSDIIAFVVFCRLRYRLTLRDLSEIMLLRGFTVSHECVRQWEAKLLPVMGEALRKRRHGTGRSSGQSWYVDETYLKVHGLWCYLYRAIDRDGNLIDTMLSATRDTKAAQRFFRSARSIVGFAPDRGTTAGIIFTAYIWVGYRAYTTGVKQAPPDRSRPGVWSKTYISRPQP